MRVAMYYNNHDVRIEEMPLPPIKKGELLVKVMASGICGSDVMEWYRIKSAPRVLGHEIAGEIANIGEGVRAFQKGDRVFVSHHVPCNTCDQCLSGHHTTCDTLRATNFYPGGFAEYVRVPSINVDRGTFILPENMPYERAVFIEPLACASRAQRMCGIEPGETVLVMGSGISGLLHIRLAFARGAGNVFATDINRYRLDMAERSGACPLPADCDIASELKSLNNDMLADKVIVCTGAESAAEQAFTLAERGGTIIFFAVPMPDRRITIPLNNLWKDEIRIMTSYGAGPADIRDAIRLIDSFRVRVDDLVTHRLPLDKAAEGFMLVANAGESCKVVILPHGT